MGGGGGRAAHRPPVTPTVTDFCGKVINSVELRWLKGNYRGVAQVLTDRHNTCRYCTPAAPAGYSGYTLEGCVLSVLHMLLTDRCSGTQVA